LPVRRFELASEGRDSLERAIEDLEPSGSEFAHRLKPSTIPSISFCPSGLARSVLNAALKLAGSISAHPHAKWIIFA